MQTTSTEKPIRKSAVAKAVLASNNILTIEFNNNLSEKNMRPNNRLPDATRKQVKVVSRYPVASGL
jgi:hypothetical protein